MLATVVGLGATWVTATRGTDLGTLTIGAWTARPKTGTADVDPYSRASIARTSLPYQTAQTKLPVYPTNHASRYALVVPVLPAVGMPSSAARRAVPSLTRSQEPTSD